MNAKFETGRETLWNAYKGGGISYATYVERLNALYYVCFGRLV